MGRLPISRLRGPHVWIGSKCPLHLLRRPLQLLFISLKREEEGRGEERGEKRGERRGGGKRGEEGEEGRDKYLIDLIRDGDFECPHVQCYVLRSKVVKVRKGEVEEGDGGGEERGIEEGKIKGGEERGRGRGWTYLLTPMMAPVTPGCFNSHASDN